MSIVEKMLKKRPDINIQTNGGLTALMSAVYKVNFDIVNKLLQYNPDLNIQDKNGQTALIHAANFGYTEVAKALLKKKQNVDIQDNNGNTSLIYASGNGNAILVNELLEHNANINIQNNSGETPLLKAIEGEYEDISKSLLILKPNINHQNKKGDTALLIAVRKSEKNLIIDLVESGADVEITNQKGESVFSLLNNIHNKELLDSIRQLMIKKDLQKLDDLTGMDNIKTKIRKLIKYIEIMNLRKEKNLPTPQISHHMIFTGNPGTGKTTVARLIAAIYRDLGILSKGHLVEVQRADLIAEYVGQTAPKVNKVIEEAKGGVLFIDEAYLLTSNKSEKDFGPEAIGTLIAGMENNRDDLIVIAGGYIEEMKNFISSNPGLKSRFKTIIEFENFTPEQSLEIFSNLAKKNGYEISPDSIVDLKTFFENQSKLQKVDSKEFGNARGVRNTFEEACINQADRVSCIENPTEKDLKLLTKEDLNIDNKQKDKLQNLISELNKMTGLESAKKQVESLVNLVKVEKIRREKGLPVKEISKHLVFKGNPGTGKTTIARIIADIYKELGIITKGQLVEAGLYDIKGSFPGETAQKVKDKCKDAYGGILFIDEAYTIASNQEAVSTLLTEMEDKRDNLIVIVAGYTDEMEKLLSSNPGIRSRFNNLIEFGDYNSKQMLEILNKMAQSSGFNITTAGKKQASQYFDLMEKHQMYSKNEFGNARGVRNYLEKAILNQATRISKIKNPSELNLTTLGYRDFLTAETEKVKKLVERRNRRFGFDIEEFTKTRHEHSVNKRIFI